MVRLKNWSKLGPAAFSAGLLLAAFPPFNLSLLCFVALVPWFASLKGTSKRGAWWRGYAFGLLFALGQLQWIGGFVAKWTDSFWLGAFPWLLASVLMAIYFGLLGRIIRSCWMREIPWAIPVAWAGMEVIRCYIPVLAFPWGLLASPLWPYTPLIQAAHFGSIVLVSAWVAAINVVGAGLFLGIGVGKVRTLITASIAVLALSVYQLGVVPESSPHRITIGQPGVDLAFDQAAEFKIGPAVNGLTQRAKADQTELLVLPEGVASGGSVLPPQTTFAIDPQVPIIFGGQRGKGPVYQSAYAFDGKRWQFADKTRLVIFGEFVPGRDVLPFLSAFNLPSGDLSAGSKLSTVTVNRITVGPLICFEGLFPDLGYRQAMSGARLLSAMSIDDWFMGTFAPSELRSALVWRSVESGLPTARAASLGYSCFIDGKGRILGEIPLGQDQEQTLSLDIPTECPTFPLFPLFPAIAVIALVAVSLPTAALRNRSQSTGGTGKAT